MSEINLEESSSSNQVVVGDILSLLDCDLCFQLICEPISVSCGHTFCRLCLIQALSRCKKQCPSCRTVCHLNAETAPENKMIKNIALKLNPEIYKIREIEAQECLKEHKNSNYPIFFYMECLFPGSKLQLHLFEPRYKLMMQRIVNASRCFAYAPFHESSCREGSIVLIFHLEDCEFLPDGRCLIKGTIKNRAKVITHHIEDGTQRLHYCNAIIFNDETINDNDKDKVQEFLNIGKFLSTQLLDSTTNSVGINLRSKIENKFGVCPINNPELFSLWLTAIGPLPENQKFSLLCSTNTLQRLEIAVGVMVTLMQQISVEPTSGLFNHNSNEEGDNDDDDDDEEEEESDEDFEYEMGQDSGDDMPPLRDIDSGDGIDSGDDTPPFREFDFGLDTEEDE